MATVRIENVWVGFPAFALSLSLAACGGSSSEVIDQDTPGDGEETSSTEVALRVASFNVSLFRDSQGELLSDLSGGNDVQAQTLAQIIQRVNPDVLLLNEFDYDAEGAALDAFVDEYIDVGEGAVSYPYRAVYPSNTGVNLGLDVNNDEQIVTEPGQPGYGDDSAGFGQFEGQYAFALISRYPLGDMRSYQNLIWADLPGALLPDDPSSDEEKDDWYSPEVREVLPLSSKNHVAQWIELGEDLGFYFLMSHPTPAGFDGPEDRNGRRNHDEIRLWREFINDAAWLVDDQGNTGGIDAETPFIIAGDLNDDPFDGGSAGVGVLQLLDDPRVQEEPVPSSTGAVEQAEAQGGANDSHNGPAENDTADFSEQFGNQRVDYVLPSMDFTITETGVFWPRSDEEGFSLVGTFPFPSSDHRLVWIDVALSPAP